MSIQKDNDAMARLYTENVDVQSIVPKQGVDTLDEYLDGLVGMTVKDVLDKESYLSLYMMNKHGVMGTPAGNEKDLKEFSSAVVAFVNRKVNDHRPRMEDREYFTPEFKDKHNFDEYEKLKRGTLINVIRIKREQGDEAYKRAKQQISDNREKMRNSEYGKAMEALENQYDQAVKDYHNTPLTKEDLANDGSPEYQKLEKMFNRLVGGQTATSEYDDNTVVDV